MSGEPLEADDILASAAAKQQRRLSGSTSWRGFFIEVAWKLAFLAVLVLVVWVVSSVR